MKTINHHLFLILLCAAVAAAQAQTTAFTYQGRLNDGGSPANGVYDFTFQAFDAATVGDSLGGTVNVNAVGVTNGLFTAVVDLSSTPFTGPARWLQISVSTNGAGSFSTLTPRQALTPSPYAVYAYTAATVTNGAIANAQLAANSVAATNILNSAIAADKIAPEQVVKSLNGLTDGVSLTQGANVTINTVGNSLQISALAGGLTLPFFGSASSTGSIFTLGNSGAGPSAVFVGSVGIGSSNPAARLEINAPDVGDGVKLSGTSPAYYLSDVGGTNRATLAYASADGFFSTDAAAGDSVLRTESGGKLLLQNGIFASALAIDNNRVGIGTPAPQAKLDVRGDIRLGPSGQFRATSGEENLRIIRGEIHADGSIVRGAGFSVSHDPDSGIYGINFTTPFASPPTVTATPTIAYHTHINGGLSSSGVSIGFFDHSATRRDTIFHFIAIGPR